MTEGDRTSWKDAHSSVSPNELKFVTICARRHAPILNSPPRSFRTNC